MFATSMYINSFFREQNRCLCYCVVKKYLNLKSSKLSLTWTYSKIEFNQVYPERKALVQNNDVMLEVFVIHI